MGAFSLESLKGIVANGYLIFTDAVETGEQINGCNFITSTTREGVDCALLNAGFQFIIEASDSAREMYWMQRHAGENLRYHPIHEKPARIFEAAPDNGLKTQIDFFCHQNHDAAYDVVRELLELGYKVMVCNPKHRATEAWYLLEPGENGIPAIRQIK
ncbi:MAG: hypothetical protein G01um101448_391 [Parcubacteria group bacterium Gr01-1014_48]|nr:MAG: hypothetical protein Greene041614_746 [Parcubacteria group bacterium Greene0416_14]TSC74011.1 MAG: hypothetical protein G01um101448_391 [Parcubacteria group bacterium Gr01-1014_48]TSD00789.1 MAG: hypothetical protein Greene101415_689 [Parcubacteria group bacterium Greene1014_15]TSD07332.1 MAG: hypothetical protein Greene07144_929 [Parcubacteria group bacterium Greene0714_4]